MLLQTFLFLGQLWQLFEVSQILEFLRYIKVSERGNFFNLNWLREFQTFSTEIRILIKSCLKEKSL